MIGGFTQWAHLRLRDNFPGPTSYTLPPQTTPGRCILEKHSPRVPDVTVGPGEYKIPSMVGDCRSVLIGPPQGPPAASDVGSKTSYRSSSKGSRRKRGEVRALPKQYSLALSPDTPAFSMYGRVEDKLPTTSAGPGDYVIPSEFSSSGKGPHFGQRTRLLNSRNNVPGPGTYNLPRFGDDMRKKKEYITAIRKVCEKDQGPGPGSYEDPNTISARFTTPKRCLYDKPRFGGRYPTKKNAIGPGPGQYGDVSRIMQKGPTHTPIFSPSCHSLPSNKTVHAASNAAPGPGNYCIPSEFNQEYPKGVSFGVRLQREPRSVTTGGVGPGLYDLGKPPMTSNGFRFAAHPFDPLASHGSTSRVHADTSAKDIGPASYFPNLDAVRPSKYRAVAGFGIGNRFTDHEQSGVLCYNIKTPDIGRGTVFHRGDYGRSNCVGSKGRGGDGLSSYNVENSTIAETVRNQKGFTFGIHYPARATHQVCKPYDETRNTSRRYED